MHCSNCKIKVLVVDGKVLKPCSCNAPIIAEMSAKAEGKASTEVKR